MRPSSPVAEPANDVNGLSRADWNCANGDWTFIEKIFDKIVQQSPLSIAFASRFIQFRYSAAAAPGRQPSTWNDTGNHWSGNFELRSRSSPADARVSRP